MPLQSALRWIYYPTLGILTWDFLNHSFFRFQWVLGPSMSPTLSPNHETRGEKDLVLIFRRTLSGSAISTLQRGDVITLTKPHDPTGESVKRVVALPGDTVLRDVRRVGKQAEEEGRWSNDLGLRQLGPVVRVPVAGVWVEGDGWRKSRDSNDFGAVSQSLINGRVWGVVWPPSRWGVIGRGGKAPDSRTIVIKGEPMDVEELDLI
jgi:inner membrane protease subunit 2